MTNSREKGKRGEREAAKELSAIFHQEFRRGQQHKGGEDSPDVVGLPGVHFEVKNTQALALYAALAQAISEAGDDLPVVLHKKNHKEWVVIHRLSDWPKVAEKVFHTLYGSG